MSNVYKWAWALVLSLHTSTTSTAQSLDLEYIRGIDTKPFSGGDVGLGDSESLTFCPIRDTFFIGDDLGDAIHQFDRATGKYRSRIHARDLEKAFPSSAQFDNGAGGTGSYTGELETVAWDTGGKLLYIVNTVNKPALTPPVDRQAIFRVSLSASGKVSYKDWHPLPLGNENKLDALVIISGRIYGGGGTQLLEYSYKKKDYATRGSTGSPVPSYESRNGPIVGLAYRAPYLWILTGSRKIVRVDWRRKVAAGIGDLDRIAGLTIGKPKGLALALGKLYVVDGDPPHRVSELRVKLGR